MRRSFVVHGNPVPWSFVAKGPGRGYRPGRVTEWQTKVYMAARACLDEREIPPTPVRIDIVVCMKRPKSRSKDQPQRFIPHIVKPDCDNLKKAIQDALVRAPEHMKAIFHDDCYFWTGESAKVWNPVGVPSFVLITLETGVIDAEAELERMGALEVLHGIAKKARKKSKRIVPATFKNPELGHGAADGFGGSDYE